MNVVTGTVIGGIMGSQGSRVASLGKGRALLGEKGNEVLGNAMSGLVPAPVEAFSDFPRKMYKAAFCGER